MTGRQRTAAVAIDSGAGRILAAGLSDPGRVRSNNEDHFHVAVESGLFIVADGLGGEQGGEVASSIVVEVLPILLEQRLRPSRPRRKGSTVLAVRDAIVDLSQHLRVQSAHQLALQGMGATVAMTIVDCRTGKAYIAHMGDSRVYLYHHHQLVQLTADHSVAALLLKHGDITPEEAHEHPARSKLSRFVGIEGEVYPDMRTIRMQDGDRLLLCSDGLTGMLADDQIAVVLHDNRTPEGACQALVAAANAAGGIDNITAVVVNWRGSPA